MFSLKELDKYITAIENATTIEEKRVIVNNVYENGFQDGVDEPKPEQDREPLRDESRD
jgi:hypothetical protein